MRIRSQRKEATRLSLRCNNWSHFAAFAGPYIGTTPIRKSFNPTQQNSNIEQRSAAFRLCLTADLAIFYLYINYLLKAYYNNFEVTPPNL
jgi:hypothetical protein